MDLFSLHGEEEREKRAPLADRLRPRSLDEVLGQEKIIGPGTLLRRMLEQGKIPSLILWGPPGSGKTTLARLMASMTGAHLIALSAVSAGVPDIRKAVAEAKERLAMQGQPTLLFIDEIHRFNKAQQDALLPFVEDGTLTLIGATTENPFFHVNSALLSRSHLFQLDPLSEEDLKKLLERALTHPRGLKDEKVVLEEDALEHLVRSARGDARRLLNALELAAMGAPRNPSGEKVITLSVAEEAMQRSAVIYDDTGDQHYDTISAFIKSVRGSDPDAALYWLAKMLDGGEDPLFIARRLVILASEDIGNAAPEGLPLAVAAYLAVERIGLPEGRIPLAQATVFLALAPKSNSSYVALERYLAHIKKEGAAPVPLHLRDAHYPGARILGYGKDYLYPHSYPGHFVRQPYLPPGVPRFYQPGELGWEGTYGPAVKEMWERSDGGEEDRGPQEERSHQP